MIEVGTHSLGYISCVPSFGIILVAEATTCHTIPRLRSALVVLVMAAKPDARLVTSLGSAVEPLVHSPEHVESTCIGGIGVVDDAVFERERAHARSLAGVRGHVGPCHGRDLRDWPLVVARPPLSASCLQANHVPRPRVGSCIQHLPRVVAPR